MKNPSIVMQLRRGVTIVELLVVIFIIGILIAILLPAVQMARESSRHAHCKNNLRQIALACQHYVDSYGHLPAGVASNRTNSNWAATSFLVRCLPYLEQGDLFDNVSNDFLRQPHFAGPKQHFALAHPVPVFACPSDSRTPGPQTTNGNLIVALTSYVGVLGTDYEHLNGVFYLDSALRMSQITDGASQTVILGERPPSTDFWYGWWYAGEGQNGTGSCDMILGAAEIRGPDSQLAGCLSGPHRFGPGKFSQMCDTLHYWSPHPGGANFAFADGSVHFLSYSAAEILPKLATRAGAEPVSLP